MPIWNQNPFYDDSGFSGITPLGPSAPGGSNGPDDPPESGAPENSADGGLDFSFDPSDYSFDQDLDFLAREYEKLYGSSPPASLYDPPEANYDPLRSALRQSAEAERDAIRQMQEQGREQLEKRQFQTLWTLMGPEVFNAFTGAGVNTGYEDQLRLQHQAEQRAAELDQQGTQAKADLEGDVRTRLAELQMQEQQTNAEREREAQRARYEDEQQRREGMLNAAQTLFQTQGERDAAEAQAQTERAVAEREYQTDLRQDTIDLISELDDDPQLAPQVAAQIQALNPDWSDQQVKARVGQMLRASQQGALNAEHEGDALVQGSAQNPVGLVDNLVSSTLSLKEEYDATDNFSPGWEGRNRTRPASSTASGREGDYLTDLEGKRQALVYQLGRAANEAEQRAYDLQKAGVQVPSEITNQIAALNKAREELKGITIDEGADADNMEKALKPVRSAVATLAGTQAQQSDPLRSNPATAPYIAAYEGVQSPQESQQAGGAADGDRTVVDDLLDEVDSDPALRQAVKDAERAKKIVQRSREIREGEGARDSQQGESGQQGSGEGTESDVPRVSADELVERVESSTGAAGTELAVSNLLREKGFDLESDQLPVVEVEQDGETQTLVGVDQIAEAARQMSASESKMQVLRNFATPFRAVWRDITTVTDKEREQRSGTPEMVLRVRYGVEPNDDVKMQEVGGGQATLIVNGQPQSPVPVGQARQRLSEIRTLQSRIRNR